MHAAAGNTQSAEDLARVRAVHDRLLAYRDWLDGREWPERLVNIGIAATMIAPVLALTAQPIIEAIGLALAVAGPAYAIIGWIVADDARRKKAWIARCLDVVLLIERLRP